MEDAPYERHKTRSGRRLAYGDYGDRSGFPTLFCHGSPGSRREAAALDAVARDIGLRLIAPERPGMGRSEVDPDATLLSHAEDALDLLDALGAGDFAVAGYSGGAAMVYALQHAAPERARIGLDLAGWAPVADFAELRRSLAPLDRFYFWVIRLAPALFTWTFRPLVRAAQDPDPGRLVRLIRSSLSPRDAEWLNDPAHLAAFHADVREACRQGPAGPARDAYALYRPWGVDPRRCASEVLIFHGEEDRFSPIAFAEWKAETIPSSTLTRLPDVGHLGLMRAFPTALRAMKAKLDAPAR